ncbi:uncharacterized protein LOC116306848 [Actinia tenebrosa]|uniref:Uncharacterized protein LOC116306848 n=1 Tax=Actinia tenebrosa TaxID=6105 RepID=A0A6P8J657_ACTTE|nr:uncharacterized protein LOC116306848 [Actinia tenebrosa]
MPKRSKKQGQKQDDHDGRPPNLTLASFMQFPDLPASSSLSVEKKNDEAVEEEKKETQTSECLRQENVFPSDNLVSSTQPGCEAVQNLNPIYHIGKTKKGKLPLTCESRAKGKKVTVISNVTGDAKALLSELKRRAGCGGVVRDEGTVELQGDRIKFLTQFLTGHPCLKPYKG